MAVPSRPRPGLHWQVTHLPSPQTTRPPDGMAFHMGLVSSMATFLRIRKGSLKKMTLRAQENSSSGRRGTLPGFDSIFQLRTPKACMIRDTPTVGTKVGNRGLSGLDGHAPQTRLSPPRAGAGPRNQGTVIHPPDRPSRCITQLRKPSAKRSLRKSNETPVRRTARGLSGKPRSPSARPEGTSKLRRQDATFPLLRTLPSM